MKKYLFCLSLFLYFHIFHKIDVSGPFWIGVNDIQDEGQYVDVNGNSLVYNNWDTGGEPDDGNAGVSHDCTAMFPNRNFRWRTNRCNRSNGRQGLCSITIPLPNP
ncbi:hypothetical protein FSP39_015754 [Pinctada imbricata]|uniref:C-type lectin domain-containing protein n=1 Tax=Pinctada imbricata TaxID=66713 RepID=A0AA88Y0C4_PINIB|nr:hypothetical protein FSP39_015754 [Pinctada imbricata]